MIFIDSSFFVALVDTKDHWHQKAKDLIPVVTNDTIQISDLIIVESVSIVGKRSGGKSGEQLYNYFTDNCHIIHLDEKLLRGGMSEFIKYDGTLSVSDAVSVFIMKKKRLDRIVSFDSDFDKVDGIMRVYE